ncbi:MAG: radical SAM protein [Polyangiaceae bacterium]
MAETSLFEKGTPDSPGEALASYRRILDSLHAHHSYSEEKATAAHHSRVRWHVDPGNLGLLSRAMNELIAMQRTGLEVILPAVDESETSTEVAHEGVIVPTLRRLRERAPEGFELKLSLSTGRSYFLPPPALDLSTNDLCGLKCNMCGNRATKRDPLSMTSEQIDSLIAEAAAWGIPRVSLTGAGEPLRDPEMQGYIAKVNELGMLATITSNGFPISDRVADELASRELSVSISIHGATNETHDAIVGVPTAGDHAWRAIRRMAAARERRRAQGLPGKLSINVSTVIQRANVHEIAELVRRAHRDGADGVNIQPINLQHGFIRRDEIVRRDDVILGATLLPSKEQRAELEKLFDELHELRRELGKFVHANDERIELMRRYFVDSSREALGLACQVGERFLAVDHRGRIKPCYRLPWTAGDARISGVRKVWNSSAYAAIRKQIDACPLTCLNNCFFRKGTS